MKPTNIKTIVLCSTWNRYFCAKNWLKNMLEDTDTQATADVILLNDSAEFRTKIEAKKFYDKHDGFGYLETNKNVGIPAILNLGLKHFYQGPTEKYLVITEDDNYFYTLNWLQIMLEIITKNPELGVLVRPTTHWHEAENVIGFKNGIPIYDDINFAIDKTFTIENKDILGPIKLISPSAMKAIGSFYEGYGRYGHEDHDFIYRIAFSGFKTAYVNKRLIRCLHGKVNNAGVFYEAGWTEFDSYSRLVKLGLCEENQIHVQGYRLATNRGIYRGASELGLSLKMENPHEFNSPLLGDVWYPRRWQTT